MANLDLAKSGPPVSESPLRRATRLFMRSPASMVAATTLTVLVLVGVAAPILAPYSPTDVDAVAILLPPGGSHIWGTDDLGRDIFSGTLYGLRISLFVGLMAGLVAAIIGTAVGAAAGYFGRAVDALLMRLTDFVLTIPVLFLALVIVSIFGTSRWLVILTIGALAWPPIARLVRAEFLKLRSEAFVEAARGYGASNRTLIFSEILPNCFDVVLVATALQVPAAILIESGLSFLGVGDPNPRSLGLMLKDAYALLGLAWWAALFPGFILSLLAVSLNLVADAFNDAVRGHV